MKVIQIKTSYENSISGLKSSDIAGEFCCCKFYVAKGKCSSRYKTARYNSAVTFRILVGSAKHFSKCASERPRRGESRRQML